MVAAAYLFLLDKQRRYGVAINFAADAGSRFHGAPQGILHLAAYRGNEGGMRDNQSIRSLRYPWRICPPHEITALR